MSRITADFLPGTLASVGDRPDPDHRDAAPDPQASPQDHYDRLHDMLDRVARDGLRSTGAAQARAAATATGADKTDPTKVPSAADCRSSLAAIADAGFTDVHLRAV